jgi:predicted ester cyclase
MNAETITRAIYEALESGDMDKVGSYLSDDFVFSGPTPEPISGEQWAGMQTLMRKAFPDWSFNLSDVQVMGNEARATHQITGTHTGDLDLSPMGLAVIPATGKSIKLPTEQAVLTFEGDKVVRFHADPSPDSGLPGLFKQLGVEMPSPIG